MDVFEFLHEKLDFVIEQQRELVANIEHTNRIDILARSSEIFNDIRTYLKVEENLLFPALEEASPESIMTLEPAMRAHEEIKDILESSVMIHVDEPSQEYDVNMRNLLELLEVYRRYDETLTFPLMRRELGPERMADIHKQVRGQLWHEALANPKLG